MDVGGEMVARTDAGWARFDPSGRHEVTLADVLELVAASGPAPAEPDADPTDAVVRPWWGWVGAVADGAVLVEDLQGEPVALDPVDLTLLDALRGPMDPPALAAATGLDADVVRRRVGRLLAAGRVGPAEAPVAPEPVAPEPAGPATIVAPPTRTSLLARGRAAVRRARQARRTPVYAVWTDGGPQLSLGMLTAAARAHDDGALNGTYEIRRPESPESFLAHLAAGSGPAVLLLSDYVWTLDANLRLAREARALRPELLVVHGGPSSPTYLPDAEAFLAAHADVAHVLVRGEGERVLTQVLEAVATGPVPWPGPAAALRDVPGLMFTDPATGELVRTPDQERVADLDSLPSPYLTGEFDDVPDDAWDPRMVFETARGCPYGCTFCDWGSSTMSRVRRFGVQRVHDELAWAARRGLHRTVFVADANFGISSRDVDVAERIAEVRSAHGWPADVIFAPAKNTTKHLTRILDVLVGSGVVPHASLSLQSTDEDTLAAIDRANISNGHFVELAAAVRRRGHPLVGELMFGLPGQTVEGYQRDLQFMFDLEVQQRTWPTMLLPNSPMNAPDYRERWAVEVDAEQLVRSTSTFDADDLERMYALRRVEVLVERLGLLRHPLRVLQWDHGVPASSAMSRLIDLADPAAGFPLWSFVFHWFDRIPAPPVGWSAFYAEARRLVADGLGVPVDAGLETAFVVQRFLMPQAGRRYPDTVALPHDYVAYYREATRSLYGSGTPTGAPRPLTEHGPGSLTVTGDPLGAGELGLRFDSHGGGLEEFYIGGLFANELESPLTRMLVPVVAAGVAAPVRDDLDEVVEESSRRRLQVVAAEPTA